MADAKQGHTPGPWTDISEGQAPQDGDRAVVSDARGRAICQCSQRNSVANARLIAAAPSLLEAATEALALLDKGASGWGVSKDLLRAAIAKSKGV